MYCRNQRSAIDYVLLSSSIANDVKRVLIDENSRFHLHIDHVIIRVTLSKRVKKEKSFVKRFA